MLDMWDRLRHTLIIALGRNVPARLFNVSGQCASTSEGGASGVTAGRAAKRHIDGQQGVSGTNLGRGRR
jgi:hypothetical protein